MTEDQLKEMERLTLNPSEGPDSKETLELIAEVRRLQKELAHARMYSTTDAVFDARRDERAHCALVVESLLTPLAGAMHGAALRAAARAIRALSLQDEP